LSVFEAEFAGLLFSVYYAALLSLVDDPQVVDFARSINACELAAGFKREVATRVMSIEGGIGKPSLLLLQAMTLVLVSVSNEHYTLRLTSFP
jgi:hypothetical protein